MESVPDSLPNHPQPPSQDKNENKNRFKCFIEDLGLKEYTQHKLTPSDVLSVDQDVLSNAPCSSIKDIPWSFLRQLMSLNTNARNSTFYSSKMGLQSTPRVIGQGTSVTRSKIPVDVSKHLSEPNERYNLSDLFPRDGENESPTVHPLDVLCALLHCSDSFLQQEIVTRLSTCQFAVPLLLPPAGDGTECTFMLWAMRDILKYLPSQTSTGEFVQHNLVNIPMPVFSFVRLGECKSMSKSKMLNQVLSLDSHSCREDFVHRRMSCGKGPRIISNGLVEITWYFPSKDTDSHSPSQPFAVTNLHGDIQTYQRQFTFLARVSSAVFIFLEDMAECGELLNERCDKFYFIVGHPSHNSRSEETKHLPKALFPSLSETLMNPNFLVGTEHNLEKQIQEIIKNIIRENPKQVTLAGMTLESAFGFCIDENQMDCQYAQLHSLEMTHDIATAIRYGEHDLKSQKKWRAQLAKAEKEMYQLVRQGKSDTEHFKSVLADKMQESLRRYLWSDVVMDLVYALTFMSRAQKQYFLKWMSFHHHKDPTNTLLGKAMRRNVFYDLVHIYQAESIIEKATEYIPRCSGLSNTAADLLLDGFPLALISEDTFSLPFQWINDVLTDLVNKTRGSCRVRVVSALGIYCTGKSSLLGTMFGLQFEVTRPQHTRGALMNLIKVKDRFKEELGCDFLLVIDTEGLRAPRLASAGERYDHDNALATFVIGISDVVIVSLSSENPSDIINTLQIAVCACLKMRDSGRKPALYFVQTNLTNASSDGENRNKGKMYECLSETIDLAAKVAKRASCLSLHDVLKCDLSSSHWYSLIPSLWQGDPLNGCLNSEYADKVMKLKKHLIHTLTQESNRGNLRTMLDFIDDIKSQWSAVNLEPILRFEHIKEVIIYTELSNLYGELEWSLLKEMYQWQSKKEQISLSHGIDNLTKDTLEQLHKTKEEKIQAFRLHLDSEKKQFEEDFVEKFQFLSQELENFYKDKCTAFQILSHGMEMAVVEDFRSQEWDPDELEPHFDFDSYWKDKVDQWGLMILKRLDIHNEFMQMLKKEMRDRGGWVTEALNNAKKLSDNMSESFTINEKHIDTTWYTRKGARDNNNTKPWNRLDSLAQVLTKRYSRYILAMVKLNKDYEPIHCLEMLRRINKMIRKETFPFTDLFEVDLKLHILSRAASAFQRTHNALLKAKEEKLFVEKQKPAPLNSLKSIVQDKRSAKQFCHLCLKPAMELTMASTLQPYIIRDIVGAVRRSRRTSQIFYVTKGFNLIGEYNHYPPNGKLRAKAISSTIETFRRVLKRHAELEYDNVKALMTGVCRVLATEPSLFQNHIAEYSLKVTSSTPRQFSSYVDFFIRQLKNDLQPNGDVVRNIILRACGRLSGCRKQTPHCTAPYDAGFRSHRRKVRHKTRKPSKVKSVGSHSWPEKGENVHNKIVREEHL